MQRVLVTSALPYANGDIHIGHLVEYIQTDIYVRYLRLIGCDVIYVCASDSHGTPIEINAGKRGISPKELVDIFHERHKEDFSAFDVSFDEFYTTDSPENLKHCRIIYLRAKQKGHIVTREIEQFYCEECGRFLPDRYIKGVCPKCKAPDQYGDVCESCGATYRPTDLDQALCALCGHKPSLRKSTHFFFKLVDFQDFLKRWTTEEGKLQHEVQSFVGTWIEQGLQDWDISRDGPYFGFQIPDEENKYFYVWLDAPIGYIAATEHYCSDKPDRTVDEYWTQRDDNVRIHHFIGKDIAYFHTLFWPAMLEAAQYRLPHAVHVHGFLTVNGLKMSKSRGTFITARDFRSQLNPLYLRYYYATKLSNSIDDLDLNIEEFVNRTNAELVNNITNLISRTLGFLNKRLDSRLGTLPESFQQLEPQILRLVEQVREDYEKLRFGAVTRNILAISDIANNYIQQQAPWATAKDNPDQARNDLTLAVNCIKIITILLKPILPSYCAQVETILGTGDLRWSDISENIENRSIGTFEKLADRLEIGAFDKLIEACKLSAAPTDASPKVPEFKSEIDVDALAMLDLRAGKITEAAGVEGADKLLKLTVDLGREKRNIFAGIKSAYKPEDLIGKTVVVVANLKPRKMRFGVSQGMVLAAIGPEDKPVVCEILGDAGPGSIIR